jgi:2-polyprenyl-3-methyl-5-hydroxy-6-metoxy-1,4-benzoquinol methylase
VRPVNVLDLACGAGYGASQLATRLTGSRVIGVDYDRVAVDAAQTRYRAENLAFSVADATRWTETIGDDRFEAIVAFDMIEHVRHREILLQNVVEHLAPAGRLLLSTPCGWDETRLEPEWAFHRIEYSAHALYDFLHRYFARVVRPEDPDFPHREVFDRLRGGPVTYALKMNPVVCAEPILVKNPYPAT